jgi:hypothetical protein
VKVWQATDEVSGTVMPPAAGTRRSDSEGGALPRLSATGISGLQAGEDIKGGFGSMTDNASTGQRLPLFDRSDEDVEWRRHLDLKWFGMNRPPEVRLFDGRYQPDVEAGEWRVVDVPDTAGAGVRVLGRPWFRIGFLPPGVRPDQVSSPSPVMPEDAEGLFVLPASPSLSGVAEEDCFLVDILVDDYVFHRKEVRLRWQSREDGTAVAFPPPDASPEVMMGRFRVTLVPALEQWELKMVVEAVRQQVLARKVMDTRLQEGSPLLLPHPENPHQSADEALVFVGGVWLSLRLTAMTFTEGGECLVGQGRNLPVWVPLSRDRYYLTDDLLRHEVY